MKIAVIGGNGQLGADVIRYFVQHGDDVTCLTHSDIELAAFSSVNNVLRCAQAGIVVNTGAMHNVDKCEANPGEAYAVNAIGARNLALVTRDLGAVVVHISTDYVFDGCKGGPYIEQDVPRPLNVYGNSKLAGEYFVSTINPKHYILRTSAIYGEHPCRAKGGQNFIDLMLRLGRERGHVRVVETEFVSPTSTLELAQQIGTLSRCNAYGLYHATAEGSCSWYEFAREIFAAAGMAARVDVAAPAEFPAKVTRPSYSVLENQMLKSRGLNVFKAWQTGVREYVRMKCQAYAAVT
jgi:dTDP-4-dehydrorhamnose reductase